jgi:hypothetical protein
MDLTWMEVLVLRKARWRSVPWLTSVKWAVIPGPTVYAQELLRFSGLLPKSDRLKDNRVPVGPQAQALEPIPFLLG